MKTILNTRPQHQANTLTDQLKKMGHHVIELPLFSIETIFFSAATDHSDMMIFVSANAVSAYFEQSKWVAKTVIAIGPATKAALEKEAISWAICPEHYASEGLLAMPCLQEIHNKSIKIICGERSKPLLKQELQARGAIVENVVCYRRNPIEYAITVLLPALSSVTDIVITSGESFEALLDLFKTHTTWLLEKNIYVINDALRIGAERLGFRSVIQAENATNEAIMACFSKVKI